MRVSAFRIPAARKSRKDLFATHPDTVLSDGSFLHDEFNLDFDGKETVLAGATISSKRPVPQGTDSAKGVLIGTSTSVLVFDKVF
jgi:hypothetical protein